jgi:hypothetical protein
MITPQLAGKAKRKARQLATGQTDVPRVLAICLAHPGASALLSTLAAEWLMVPDLTMQVPIVGRGEKSGVFFGPRDGVIVPTLKSISAILLIALWDRQLDVIGMLHPNPTVPLDYRVFGAVPFLRVEWPLSNPIDVEWVIGDPSPLTAYHVAVALTDDELRGK